MPVPKMPPRRQNHLAPEPVAFGAMSYIRDFDAIIHHKLRAQPPSNFALGKR